MIEMIQNADLSILHAIQGAASPALDTFMVGFTTLGEFGALWAIAGAIMIALNKHRTFGIAIFVAIALAFVIGDIGLKNVIERPRPFLVDPVLTTSLISLPDSFSCPSGHSSTSFAAATAIQRGTRPLTVSGRLCEKRSLGGWTRRTSMTRGDSGCGCQS